MPGELPLAAAAVLRRADGRYLLIRRAAGLPGAGYWTPVTGRLEPGESPARTAEREVREEVGLEVRCGPEVHRCPTADGRWLLIWVEARLRNPAAGDGALDLKRDEVVEARWVSASEALRLEPMFPATRAFFAARRRPTSRVHRWLRRSSIEGETHVCPWWFVYTFDNAVRGLLHRPEALFRPYVREGMTVLDIGCGRGFNTLALARLVGRAGSVVAVDLQQAMLAMAERRLKRAGLAGQVVFRRCREDDIAVTGPFDFVNAFWMVHEVADTGRFLCQIFEALRPGGRFFVAEPLLHVSSGMFAATAALATAAGFRLESRPPVRISRAAVLRRPAEPA